MNHWKPEVYSENNNFQFESSINLISNIEKKNNLTILDIGSGDGRVSAYAYEYFSPCKLIGIDKSKQMVDHASKTYSYFKELQFLNDDIESFHAENRFDLVLSFWAASWFIKHEEFIKNVYLSLKNGAMFKCIAPLNNPTLEKSIQLVCSRKAWADYFIGFHEHKNTISHNLYDKLLNEHNFSYSSITEKSFPLTHNSSEDLTSFISSWLPHLALVPDHEKYNFMKEITKAYCKINKEANQYTIKFDALVITCIK